MDCPPGPYGVFDVYSLFTIHYSLFTKEKGERRSPFSCYLAERTGLEPATPGVTGRYSNQLNYRSNVIYLVGAERLELPTFAL